MSVGHAADRLDVLVIGAGITGIYQLHRSRAAGFSVHLVEAGTGVGGTWFWNRYPGARFDSESYTYGYLFSRELFDEWEWAEHFAAQPETERYLNHVVDRFDLRQQMTFGVRVVHAAFDEAAAQWTVTLDNGAELTARFVISATGSLSIPHTPDIPGREDFLGVAHHTGSWPTTPVDFRGEKVAVIGTSSSGVQVVSSILGDVAELVVYQRTANWCTPLNNSPITPDEQSALRSGFESMRDILNTSVSGFTHPVNMRRGSDDPTDVRRAFFETMWNSPGFMKLTSNYADLLFADEINDEWCGFIADKIRSIVVDPVVAECLIPTDHRYGQKRPPFVTGYFEAFNDPKVTLVDLSHTPMVRVTETGIETTDGVREFDVIIWATGFDFGTGALRRMGITGRDGVSLNDRWVDGPCTFLGLQTHGFPNLFFPGGPHAAAGNNPRYNGDLVDLIVDLLTFAAAAGHELIEVSAEAEERWTRMIDKAATRNPFGIIGQYVGSNVPGKPRRYLINAAGRIKLFEVAAELRANDFAAFEFSRTASSSPPSTEQDE